MQSGLRNKGLTSCSDAEFSLFSCKALFKAAGYSDDALDRPIVGIIETASASDPCHGGAPQLIEAIRRGVMLATDRIRFLDQQRTKREGRAVEEVAAASTATIPAGRYGEPQEYADVVALLASAPAFYLNGTVVRVDGGMTANS